MSLIRNYFFPVFVSLALHFAVVALILWVKPGQAERTKPRVPNYVNAKLVEIKAKVKEPPKPAKKTPKKIDLTKQKNEAEARKKREDERKRQLAIKQKREKEKAERERQEREAATRREAERKRQEDEARQQKQREFDEALKAEELALEAEMQELEAASFSSIIYEKITQRWSRPDSARKGMKCELLIRLVPTGNIVNVSVIKSSGNEAFDRSAVQAVNSVGQFQELKGMDSALFEKYFRELTLIFNPEDLRL